MLKQYGSVLGRIEQTYGVPGEIIVAIWGLETDYGVNLGKFQTLRSLASLAYDCRRSDLFKAELMDALRIVERGDIPPQDLRGAWAGEIGQTQFMPSSYIKYAVDFDGNGKRDLLRSVPDVLGLDRELPRQQGLAARQGLGSRAAPISLSSRSGTRARSTRGPSAISPPSSPALLSEKKEGRSHSDRPLC